MRPLARRFASLAVLSTVLWQLSLAAPADAANGSVRYASPQGSGTGCSSAAPCSLLTAVNNAASGDEVVVAPGTYGSADAPITDLVGRGGLSLDVHAANASRPPTVFTDDTSDGVGIRLGPGSHLSSLTLISSDSGSSLIVEGTVDHVTVYADQAAFGACRVNGELAESLCVAMTGTNLPAVSTFAASGSAALTLGHVTAVSTGPGGVGLAAVQTGSGAAVVKAVSSILSGTDHDVSAVANTGTIAVGLSHSDYSPQKTYASNEATVTGDATDIASPPHFVGSGSHPYAEAKGSPTINRGGADPAGTTDVLGQPRTLGPRPDVGAYEFAQAPQLSRVRVTKRTSRGLTVTITVNAEGLPSAVAVTAGGKRYGTRRVTGNTATQLRMTLRRLHPHTTYKLVVTARNSAGRISAVVRAKTTR